MSLVCILYVLCVCILYLHADVQCHVLFLTTYACNSARLGVQGSSMHIDSEEFELRQLAWTTVTQLLQHNSDDSSSQACSFIR